MAAAPADGLRRVLPLRRWKVATGIAAALFAVMCVPLFAIGPPRLDSHGGLFSFGISLFQWFWLLGWAVGAALPGLALALLLLGREVVVARPGLLHLRLEMLGFGLGVDYPAADVIALRSAAADAAHGTAWRGSHLMFDYHAMPVPFGTDLDPTAASELRFALQQVLAQPAPVDVKPPAAPPAVAPASGVTTDAAAPAPSAAPSMLALLSLIAANLVPLGGVLLCGWKVGEIRLVYWAESVIIGLINVAKLVVIGRWAATLHAPFFVGHYGAFMAAHLLLVVRFFLRGPAQTGDLSLDDVAHSLAALWPALLGLTASHLLSFWRNFIGRGEYTRIKLSEQMNAPYQRVFVMQFTIIIGGMLTIALGSSLPALLLLLALKLLVDMSAHRAERRRAQPRLADEV